MTKITTPVSIGLIDAALSSALGAELGSGENTHEPALRFIGQLVQQTQSEELIAAIVEARLPENHAGNTRAEIPKMITSAIKKGIDKPSDKKAAKDDKQSTEAMSEIKTSGMTLSHDKLGTVYGTFNDYSGSVVIPVDSSEMKERIQFTYFVVNGKALAQSALTELADAHGCHGKHSPTPASHLSGNDASYYYPPYSPGLSRVTTLWMPVFLDVRSVVISLDVSSERSGLGSSGYESLSREYIDFRKGGTM